MSLSLGLGLALTRNKGGADALHGVQVQAARSPGRTFFRNGLRRSTALTDVATVTRAAAKTAFDQAGSVATFAAGVPAVTTAGLAISEGAVHNSLYSQAFATNWAQASAPTLTAAYATAPDGTQTATRLQGSATNSGVYQTGLSFSATPSVRALFVRDNGGANKTVSLGLGQAAFGGTGGDRSATFNAATGAFTAVDAVFTKTEAIPLAGGWWLVLLYFTPSTATSSGALTIYATATNTDVLIWGSDLVAKPFYPGYAATGASPVTVAPDIVSETISIPPGQSFTVQGRVILPPSTVTNACLFDLVDTTSSPQNRLSVSFTGGSQLGLYCNSAGNGVGGAALGSQSVSGGQPVGFCVSISGSTVRYSVNGGAPVTYSIAGGAFSAALTRLFLGCTYASTLQLNGVIRDLSTVMRDLADSEMRAASDVTLTHDIDFVSQVYQYVGAPYVTPTDLPGTTFTRATTKYAANSAGVLVPFAAGAPAVTDAGLSVEAAATNSLLWSQDFTQAAWAATGAKNLTANSTIAPDGTLTATTITDNSAVAYQGTTQTIAIPNDGLSRTLSFYVKKTTGGTSATFGINSGLGGGTPVTISIRLNTDTGVLTSSGGATAGVINAGAFWRVWVVITNNSSGNTSLSYSLYPATSAYGGTNDVVTAMGSAVIWGAQVETGSFPTSYIPTTSASATRNTDALTSANDTNPSAYTIVAEFTVPLTGPAYSQVWHYDDGTDLNRTTVYFDQALARLYALVTTGNVTQALLNMGTVTPGQSYKVAFAVAPNDFAAVMTGGSVQTDASGTVPATSNFRVGHSVYAANVLGSPIKRIRRFSVRKTNSELQALVA